MTTAPPDEVGRFLFGKVVRLDKGLWFDKIEDKVSFEFYYGKNQEKQFNT